jgi:SAM-dependent methyltransferase
MKDQVKAILQKLGALGAVYPWYERAEALDMRTLRQNARYRGKTAPDGLPVPPLHLLVKVNGTASLDWFYEGGRSSEQSIRQALGTCGQRVEDFRSMLDFGCGCGRVIRRWHALTGTRVCGTDYNPSLIAWCRRHLPFAQYEVNALNPPLSYADGEFEFVYALSVFTHWPEALQQEWLKELRRILSPGGFLLLTTHGEYYSKQLTSAERRRFEAHELVIRYEETAGLNLCAAFCSEAYGREQLAHGFEVLSFIPAGAACQDLYLLRKLP